MLRPVMTYCCLVAFLLLAFICTGARSQNERLNFTGAIYHLDTQTYKYRVNITQNTLMNQTILTAQCTDRGDPTAIITYSLPSTLANSLQYFTMSQGTGEVKLAVDSLTLEDGRRYDARIRCSSSTYSVTASLRVHYQLKNEFSPVFSISNQLQFFFTENNDISGDNAVIYDFNATDNDRGACGSISYSITSRNADLFQIDSTTGVLSFVGPLDRETRDQHTVLIQASNPLCPTNEVNRIAHSSVDIRVEDANDTPPQFTQVFYNANIRENTEGRRFLLKVICSDPDTNSQVSYFLQDPRPDPFFVDHEGNVFVEEPFDYETTPSFSFLVFCRDERGSEGQVDNATVNVAIIPVNEYRPTFTPTSLVVTLPDIAPGGTVIVAPVEQDSNALKTYTVTDKDRGSNHGEYNFTISFTDGSNYSENFDFDYKTGIIRLKRKFVKTVCGQDNGGGTSAKIRARITACDIQNLSSCEILNVQLFILTSNCSVYFPRNSTDVSVSELTPSGESILSLPCEDHSSHTNKTVTILSPNDKDSNTHFSYNSKSGNLYLSAPLDYEIKDVFSIQLNCKNDYNTTASVHVVVSVLPENEYRPVFDESVYIVRLDDPVATLPLSIEQIHANDRDRGVGGNLTYSLAEPSRYFTISPDGQLLLSQILPESETLFWIVAIVSDGEFSANATIIITTSSQSMETEDSEYYTVLVIVFSATLIFVVILLLLSWLLVCHLLCRRSRKKRVGHTFSEPNNRQNLDFLHYSMSSGQPIDCTALDSTAFPNDPAFKSSSTTKTHAQQQEPEYETILCKAENYSEPVKAKNKHMSVTSQNSTDCYVSMQNPGEAFGQNEYTIQGQEEQDAVLSRGGRNNSTASRNVHPLLKANASVGDVESSLEFGGAVETSLEFGGMRGISLDYAGPSRLCEGGTLPRTPSRGNFETISELGESQLEHRDRQPSFADADFNKN